MAISPALRGIFLILRRCSVQPSTPLAGLLPRRRGKMSLLIRCDATLRISAALHLALFEQPGEDDFFSSPLVFVDWGGSVLLWCSSEHACQK